MGRKTESRSKIEPGLFVDETDQEEIILKAEKEKDNSWMYDKDGIPIIF